MFVFLKSVILFSIDKQKEVAGIVPAIEKARLYRGKGGEIMRAAVSRFIECLSAVHLSLSENTKRKLLDTLSENLRHPNSHIQVDVLLCFPIAHLFSPWNILNFRIFFLPFLFFLFFLKFF